ncbi:MAG: DUF3089 domain-containing protein [Candidatus Omnitrophica bacterium]|nr:DUF3089 domain-containing protein [Candidatus Omnitrophota bacterium]
MKKKILISCMILVCIAAYCLLLSAKKVDFSHSKKGTDYSNISNWSIQSADITREVDVFFVYPTTYGAPSNGKYLADLNDKKLNEETDSLVVNRLTKAFSESCNVFAPRYRQVNIEVLSMPEEQQEVYLATPTRDIKAALTYYLKNLNNRRPFILASHSQGSNVLQRVILDDPNILGKDKLVAAYMPGWTFTVEDLKNMGLELSTTSDHVGGVIVWNTIGPGGQSPVLMDGAKCVNPLSWTTDTLEYPASMNMGARILLSDGKEIMVDNFTSARINDSGGLVIPDPKQNIAEKLTFNMGPKCYHPYDFDFFFNNITSNVKTRCAAYFKKHKTSEQ